MAESYRVVWDGCRTGPGGAYLDAAPEGERAPAVPLYRTREGVLAQVLAVLALGPATARQLAVATGLKPDAIRDQLRPLQVQGIICTERGGWQCYTYALARDAAR